MLCFVAYVLIIALFDGYVRCATFDECCVYIQGGSGRTLAIHYNQSKILWLITKWRAWGLLLCCVLIVTACGVYVSVGVHMNSDIQVEDWIQGIIRVTQAAFFPW